MSTIWNTYNVISIPRTANKENVPAQYRIADPEMDFHPGGLNLFSDQGKATESPEEDTFLYESSRTGPGNQQFKIGEFYSGKEQLMAFL